MKKRIDEIEVFLKGQTTKMTDYEEMRVCQLAEMITFFDDHLIFEINSGIDTKERYKAQVVDKKKRPFVRMTSE